MGHWATWKQSQLSVQGCYIPGNEEAKNAFEALLVIACGRKFTIEQLRTMIDMSDGGRGVIKYIDRFLGFEPREAGDSEES